MNQIILSTITINLFAVSNGWQALITVDGAMVAATLVFQSEQEVTAAALLVVQAL